MFQINKLPFYYKANTDQNNGGIVSELEFELYIDKKYNLLSQRGSEKLNKILNDVYTKGSLVDGSASSESGKVYINKIINYLYSNFEFNKNSNVLEIGFGSGVLLKELHKKGMRNLVGIEPGNHLKIEGLEEITLIQDYFPSKLITKKFDLIYSFAILEHIDDPLQFVNDQIQYLNKNGKIIFGVPNCDPYIKEGDISFLIHEHFSYFTKESIYKLIDQTSYNVENIEVIEGAYFVTISKSEINQDNEYDVCDYVLFRKKIADLNDKINKLLIKFNQNEIAVYNPGRALNFLYINDFKLVRIVDDSSELRNKYLPTLESRIENLDDLLISPPKIILIFSRTFGEQIRSKLKSKLELSETTIYTLNDINKL